MEIPLLFRCDECGYDLKAELTVMYTGEHVVHVQPCQYCMDIALDEAYENVIHVLDEDCSRRGRRED